MTRFGFVLIAFSAIAAGAAHAGERLSDDQLKADYSGTRLYANTPTGRVVQHDYNSDGTISGVVGGKDRDKDLDQGSWWVEGGTLCRTWNNWREAKPDACISVENRGDTAIWYRPDGSVYRQWRVARDDPTTQVAHETLPSCDAVGGYEAHMAATGKPCQYSEPITY